MQAEGLFKGKGNEVFPFKLEDLVSWTVRRKDGTVSRFTLTDATKDEIRSGKGIAPSEYSHHVPETSAAARRAITSGLGNFCDHTPDLKRPIAEFDQGRGAGLSPVRLYVGNYSGARSEKNSFDFIIDCGDVISLWGKQASKVLDGDEELIQALRPLTVEYPRTRVLKIDWADRKAPDVIPSFWNELSQRIAGDVMTCCIGGHGRSGTSLVCLMLANAPDYDALDAIVHLRAVHCPRAIESIEQHEYIDEVAVQLGREGNAKLARKVKDYKAAFCASEKPTAARTRKILGW